MRIAHSEGVRRTLGKAQAAAARDRHRFVHTEHVLIGLLEERSSATSVLKTLGFNRDTLRLECEGRCHAGNSSMEDNLKLTPRVQEIMAFAGEESKKLGDEKLDTRHMVLGMLLEDGGIAGAVLRDAGLTYETFYAASVDYSTARTESPSKSEEDKLEHTEKRTRKKSYESRPLWRRFLRV